MKKKYDEAGSDSNPKVTLYVFLVFVKEQMYKKICLAKWTYFSVKTGISSYQYIVLNWIFWSLGSVTVWLNYYTGISLGSPFHHQCLSCGVGDMTSDWRWDEFGFSVYQSIMNYRLGNQIHSIRRENLLGWLQIQGLYLISCT